MQTTNTPNLPPWMAADLFGCPNAGVPYGYVDNAGRRVNCSFERLEATIREDREGTIKAVWTPLDPARLVPPEEVPFWLMLCL